MPEERTIPVVQSVAEFIITVNGTEIPRTVSKLSVNVMKLVNKISSAILVLQDGDPATGEFPLSEGDLFVPGNTIEIAAGEPDATTNIFKGIIIKQSLKLRSTAAPQLIVECKHKAVKTTIGRNSACFHDQTDSDIITSILQTHDFSGDEIDIESTTITHKELVQYNCTDWDFILSRAEMLGKMILTNDEKITIKTPTVSGDAALSLLYGATIIELDAEMDSRDQYTAVKSVSWDVSAQAVAESNADEPSNLEEEGSLSASDLAAVSGVDEFVLNHAGAIIPEERKAWADAQLLRSRLSKIKGRAKFGGIATINAGDIIELNGLGERFNGKAFVSGVRHDYTLSEGWKTQAQFGYSADWFAEQHTNIVAAKAGGIIPGAIGLHIGIVTDNEDPDGEQRVRVKIPFISPDDDGVWARIALADAGNNRGLFFRPEIGDEVVIGFLYDDPRQPVIIGMLHSSALTPPLQPSNNNNLKGYTSREQMKMIFDDENKELLISTPAGNKITLSDNAQGITIEDQNGNKIEMTSQGISIQAAKKLELKAGTDVTIDGSQISVNANAALDLKASGTGKLESSSALTIRGSVVNIN